MAYLKQTATVKELKAIIKDLPDDTMVVTSEKFCRGGLMQAAEGTFYIPYSDAYYSLDDTAMEEALDDVKDAVRKREVSFHQRIERLNNDKYITENHRKSLLDSSTVAFNEDMNLLLKVKKQVEDNLAVDECERKNNTIELSCGY